MSKTYQIDPDLNYDLRKEIMEANRDKPRDRWDLVLAFDEMDIEVWQSQQTFEAIFFLLDEKKFLSWHAVFPDNPEITPETHTIYSKEYLNAKRAPICVPFNDIKCPRLRALAATRRFEEIEVSK